MCFVEVALLCAGSCVGCGVGLVVCGWEGARRDTHDVQEEEH